MSWYSPTHQTKTIIDINKEFESLLGELEDEQAQITLAQFLYRNLGFTVELLTGIKLYPDQIILLKGWLESDYSLSILSRGLGKTTLAAIFAILICIFKPGTNVLIAGPTFRTARFIFNYIEKTTETKEAKMLLACMGAKSKRNDEFVWRINGGSIVAIPLNGEKIRGFRANVLIIDEFLLMPEELVERVLIPYLVVPQDLKQRQQIREIENGLIQRGLLTEEERTKPKNSAKMIGLSSASYKCEYLYRKFQEYTNMIYSPQIKEGEDAPKVFISQMAWNGIPKETIPDRIDKKLIELASSNQSNSASFQREYGAQFIDGSDGYFSMNKMMSCSIPDGQEPTLLLKGAKDKKYLLAIDPNLSGSDTADHFAMCVIELEEKDNKVTGNIVHSYAQAGKDLKDHIAYFHYILTHFNIEMIIIDNAGYQFLDSSNESELFRNSNLNIKVFEFDSTKDGNDYAEELRKAKIGYNKQMQCIAFTQPFGVGDFISKANEWLQGCIDYKRIWFAGGIKANVDSFNKALSVSVPSYALNSIALDSDGEYDSDKLMNDSKIGAFIDNQERLIKQIRYECAAIEVKISIKGVQTYDLPDIIKRDRSPTRMRRDSYTSLLLGCWLMRAYQDITKTPVESFDTFTPFFC